MSYYAVANGRQQGIFNTWVECEKQVKGFSGARYKKFKTKSEAEQFIKSHKPPVIISSNSKAKIFATTSTTTTADSSNNFVRMITSKKNGSPSNKIKQNNQIKPVGIYAKQKHPPIPKSRKNDFNTIRRNHLGDPIVYTDGACMNNGKRNAKAGIGVFWAYDHPDNISRRIRGRQTNNRAEIEAAIVAIQTALKNNCLKLNIYTDSKFMITAMTEWFPKWKLNGWKLSTGETVKNKEDFCRLDEEISKMDRLIWTKVRAHSGDYGNEMADKLATNSIK